jgi:predicted nucleic acid-binding Zn ribbon protein
VYTEEEKAVLRDRLATARRAKAEKKLNEPPAPPPDNTPAPATLLTHTPMTERQWETAPIDLVKVRLAALREDFETGSRIVGQRRDANDPHRYKCFVCSKPVEEAKWSSKQDYLDPHTHVYESLVICSQHCHAVLTNDTRMMTRMRDIINGRPDPGIADKIVSPTGVAR